MSAALSPARIRRVDRSGMLGTVLGFPRQVAAAYRLPRPAPVGGRPAAVAVIGMGGSAIGGDLLSSVLQERGGPPVAVGRDFGLPPHVGRKTLVFAVSYSGNTEETLSACEVARRRGCRVVTLSAGGALERSCGGAGHIRLPPGYQPRAALAFTLMPIMGALEDLGVADFESEVAEAVRVLSAMRRDISPSRPAPGNGAKRVAAALHGRFPTVLSGRFLAPAARRWRTQLAENAKVLSRDGVLPELGHNDLVAWAVDPAAAGAAVVLLRDSREDPRLARRLGLARQLGLDRAGAVDEVRSRGRGALARLLSCVFFGDVVSVYLAALRGVDPTPVPAIEELKRALAGDGE